MKLHPVIFSNREYFAPLNLHSYLPALQCPFLETHGASQSVVFSESGHCRNETMTIGVKPLCVQLCLIHTMPHPSYGPAGPSLSRHELLLAEP